MSKVNITLTGFQNPLLMARWLANYGSYAYNLTKAILDIANKGDPSVNACRILKFVIDIANNGVLGTSGLVKSFSRYKRYLNEQFSDILKNRCVDIVRKQKGNLCMHLLASNVSKAKSWDSTTPYTHNRLGYVGGMPGVDFYEATDEVAFESYEVKFS